MIEFFIYKKDTKEFMLQFWDKERNSLNITTFDIYFKMKDEKQNKIILTKYHKAGSLTVTGEQVGIGDGATTSFNLDHTKIVPGSEKIYLDDELKTRDTDYTINNDTGVITFTNAPGNGVVITADYTYQDETEKDGIVTYTDEYERGIYSLTGDNQIAVLFKQQDTENLKPGVYPFVIEIVNNDKKFTIYKNDLVIKQDFTQ